MDAVFVLLLIQYIMKNQGNKALLTLAAFIISAIFTCKGYAEYSVSRALCDECTMCLACGFGGGFEIFLPLIILVIFAVVNIYLKKK